MNTLYIPVHSFVDLITNSSSEIFVSADQNTLNAIEALVQNILIAGGSTAKASDLFTFELSDNTVIINSKVESDESHAAAARLSSLVGLFDVSARYND